MVETFDTSARFWRTQMSSCAAHLQSADGQVLDLGCGTGQTTAFLAGAIERPVIGLDVDANAIATARSRYPHLEFVHGDILNMPFAARSVGGVFSRSVLQYVPFDEALGEVLRVLRPGAPAALIENLANSPWARGYRALHRRLRWAYPASMTPLEHLRLEHCVAMFSGRFAEVRVDAAHLLSPLALCGPTLSSRIFRHRPRPSSTLMRSLEGLDERLLRNFPSLRRYCWQVQILAKAP